MRTNSQRPSHSLRIIPILALVLMMSQGLCSQSILSGLGVELGGGHNQLFWSAPTQYLPPAINTVKTANRTDLSFTPTVRVNYQWNIAQTLAVIPFVGYNQFGGKSKLANGYQDQFWFDAMEGGAFGMYVLNDISFGVGLKANYHLKVTGRWYGSALQTSSAGASWQEDNVSDWFTKWSGDAGVRVSYKYEHFSLSLDSWFGVTKLQAGIFSPATIRENQFRALLGYTI
jgi:hypothetical protein